MMATDEPKIEDTRTTAMASSRLTLLKRLRASVNPLLYYLLYYILHYSPATLLASYLLYVTFDSVLFEVLMVVAIIAFLYSYQDSLLYHPDTPSDSRYFVDSPSRFGLPHEDVFLHTRDGVRLHAYLIKQLDPHSSRAFTVIFFHGNAGNIGHRLVNAQYLYVQCRVNILLLDYRGYGRSQGIPSEEGLLIDATTAVDYISSREDLDDSKIILFGRSLGGAVAISTARDLAPRGRVAGIVVENTFTSLVDMAKAIFKVPIFDYWPTVLVKNKFPSIDKISEVQIPMLFISGLKDELVPPAMMRTLFERSRSILKRLFLCPSGTHNESWRCPGYYEQILSFLKEVEHFQRGKELEPSQVLTSPS